MAAQTRSNIIRKVEIIEEGGHHGGAWKVAYADFMTAMMAFFLLLWILSSSDEQKLRGIAEYFTNATMPNGSGLLDGATFGPPGTLNASRGSVVARGSDFGEEDDPSPAKWEVMDITPTADPEETMRGTYKGQHDNPAGGAPSEVTPPAQVARQQDSTGKAEDPAKTAARAGAETATLTAAAQAQAQSQAQAEALQAADAAQFDALQAELRQAMQENPDLKPLEKNVIFERTPDGMRIQVVDQQGQPMFATGSAEMRGATLELMEMLGKSLAVMPNAIVISGHTDAVPFSNRKAYDNWDLSTDRANAMRRVLVNAGVEQARITRVSGMADTELLVPDNPLDPSNRRISVLLEYRKPATAPAPAPQHGAATSAGNATKPETPRATDPAPRKAEAPAPEPAPERVSQLDDSVFEDLRSALR